MLRTELCTESDSYPKGGGEVCWFSSESVDWSGMLLKNGSICGDNKLLGTIPESLGVVWKGLCFTCFKCVNKSLFIQHGEKLLLLHHLPTSHGPTDLIPSLPQDPQDPPWCLLLLKQFPAPGCLCSFSPYLSELPIILLCPAETHLTLSFACPCA